MDFYDYSGRRGTLVPLLAKVHAMFTENAQKDKSSGIPAPEHVITWRQKMGKNLSDVNRRFLVALDGPVLAGVFFYRYEGSNIYVEDLQINWAYRNNPKVLEGLLKKLDYDHGTKDAIFYAGERIKAEADKEMLASVGIKEVHENGWEQLGKLSSAVAALKLRYNRGTESRA